MACLTLFFMADIALTKYSAALIKVYLSFSRAVRYAVLLQLGGYVIREMLTNLLICIYEMDSCLLQ